LLPEKYSRRKAWGEIEKGPKYIGIC